jgi:hypothetical protein
MGPFLLTTIPVGVLGLSGRREDKNGLHDIFQGQGGSWEIKVNAK